METNFDCHMLRLGASEIHRQSQYTSRDPRLLDDLQFFTLGSSKMEVFETDFFDIVITQNDHARYVKHVLGRICVFFTLFGYWARGGGEWSPKGLVQHLLMQFFTLGSSKMEVFETFFFDIVIT